MIRPDAEIGPFQIFVNDDPKRRSRIRHADKCLSHNVVRVDGIVRGETPAAFTVVTANETLTIPRDEIDTLKPSATSMMPDDQLKPFKDDEVRALFAYLRSPTQVPILATADNLKDFFATNNMKFEEIALPTAAETEKAYDSGRCDVLTTDVSGLYAERVALSNPSDHVVLADVISKEPLGPAVRDGDDQWFKIVKWTLFAMLNAEELGVSKDTLDAAQKSTKPDVMRLVGNDGNFGEQLGLTKDWFYRIIKAVGNYGESFDRNVGSGSKLQIARGLNQLWNKGGIQYAPPIR